MTALLKQLLGRQSDEKSIVCFNSTEKFDRSVGGQLFMNCYDV